VVICVDNRVSEQAARHASTEFVSPRPARVNARAGLVLNTRSSAIGASRNTRARASSGKPTVDAGNLPKHRKNTRRVKRYFPPISKLPLAKRIGVVVFA